jgi:hypothetical protein
MSTISVSLSSTKHTLAGTSPDLINSLHQCVFPVCVAEMGLGLFGFNERDELGISTLCKNMAKTVYVDSEKQYVFIGENPQIPESALVEYTEQIKTTFTESFFCQWNSTHCMIFEFNCIGTKGTSVFCLRGIWVNDKWQFMDIEASPNITVVSRKGRAS